MERKSWRGWVILWALSMCLLLQVNMLQAAEIDPAMGEYAQGTYVNKVPPFSVKFPTYWVAQKPFLGEVFRIANNNEWSLPVATLTISDKAKDAPVLDSEAAVEAFMKSLQETNPQSSRHRVESKGTVKLNDGSQAMTLIVKWKWDVQTTLMTAVLVAYKGDKIITLANSTTLGGQTQPEALLEMLKTLTFN